MRYSVLAMRFSKMQGAALLIFKLKTEVTRIYDLADRR